LINCEEGFKEAEGKQTKYDRAEKDEEAPEDALDASLGTPICPYRSGKKRDE
jgi:hypothetical protein